MRSMSSLEHVISSAFLIAVIAGLPACGGGYKATPVGFELPERYPNATQVAGATVGAVLYERKGSIAGVWV
jgi:hypothetical protein